MRMCHIIPDSFILLPVANDTFPHLDSPPCRHFTPTLSAKYTALKNAGKKIEIVFVSSDRDEASFKQYHSEMTFLALPFSARGAKAALADRFGVQGIPMLVFVDAQTGELLTKDGRTAISASSFIADFPYRASAAQLAAQNADASPSPLQLLLVCAVLYFVYTKYFAPAGSNLR